MITHHCELHPCGCLITAHPDGPLPHHLDSGYHYERCELGWPLLGIDGSPLLTREGERLSLELMREDDTAEYVLEYLDLVRDTGRLHPLRRGLALEVIGCLTVLRISDDAFTSIALTPRSGNDRVRQNDFITAVCINLGARNFVVVPMTPIRPEVK